MAKRLLALYLTALICATTYAPAAGQRSIGQTKQSKEKYENNEQSHPLPNYVLADVDYTTADMEKYNPLILRHVENNLRNLAEKVKEKRMLICSTKPRPYCDIIG